MVDFNKFIKMELIRDMTYILLSLLSFVKGQESINMYEGSNFGLQAALVFIIMFLLLLAIVITVNLLQRWYVNKQGGQIK
ncbi:hypothetical protein LSH36_211g04015 [Paralvinella palmiformis]|uniref:Uncharacterized protein n=1 Tax=Paralvinella palmiformis TaxID=53620 RepID=A0AAD9N5U3_9ANNE|nr:hypothetical protein LSH36_211g04015 [Paralvinella palmiformis]